MPKLIVDVILFDEIINYCVTYKFDLTLFQQHNHGQDSKGYSSSEKRANEYEKKEFGSIIAY